MISQWGYEVDFDALYASQPSLYDSLNLSKVLVTGATGLVGTCLTEFLLYLQQVKNIDVSITALSSSETNLLNRFGQHVAAGRLNVLEHDIRKPFDNNHSFDFIVHAASVANPVKYEQEPVDVIEVIVQGTKNILELSKASHAKMLYVSTVEVYGDISSISSEVDEEQFGALNPFMVRCSYTEGKRVAETLCKAYQIQYGVDVRIARLSKVYGPSNSDTDNRVMAFILNSVKNGKDIVLNSDGTRIFSFCYVTDAVSGIMTSLLSGSVGEAYNISDAKSICSLKEIAEFTARLAGVSVKLNPIGVTAISRDTVVCSRKLESLGWAPLTDMKAGLRKQMML